MPTNTYVALRTTTVGTATPSVTLNLSGITGYTDLVLVSNVLLASGGQANLWCRFNGDTGGTTNYSTTYLAGNGTSSSSARDTSASEGWCGRISSSNWTTSIASFQNYSNSTNFKTSISRGNDTSGLVIAFASLWRQTAAISSITLTNSSAANFAVGSTFTIYGIAAASVGAKATGGTIYTDSQYFYHVFAGNGTFTPTQSISADVLVVAGGGGGCTNATSGGGGAGGLLLHTSQSLTATNYTCTIGAGGATAGAPGGANGVNSSFGGLTASVGGGGGGATNTVGKSGGSGGGGGGGSSAGAGGAGTSGQGFAGGNGYQPGSDQQGGGGGGAGAVGQNGLGAGSGTPQNGGNGGAGLTSSFINSVGIATGFGQLVSGNYYLAGGGGAHFGGSGGAGGGGGGTDAAFIAGTPNTGGGGKGGGSGLAGAGGSGVVIVRYAK